MALFKDIIVEKEVLHWPRTREILEYVRQKNLASGDLFPVERLDPYFGAFKKPYLKKRGELNLLLGIKRGQLVKRAPDAYGSALRDHYYFIHTLNCVYECEYCYLQGHFNSPDIVAYLNHQDIMNEMKALIEKSKRPLTFHAGEFSDTLALSNWLDEWPSYLKFFQEHPSANLELRTKSVNISPLLQWAEGLKPSSPPPNIIVSFSLAPQSIGLKFDRKTPSPAARLKAISKLAATGFSVALHFDPIIYQEDLREQYSALLKELRPLIPPRQIPYISIGVVRFPEKVFKEVKKNYPESPLFEHRYSQALDQKHRYFKPLRLKMLNTVEELLKTELGMEQEKIYRCME